MKVSIRKGIKSDLPAVLDLIKELAEFERALNEVIISLEDLEQDGFGNHPYYWFIVAERDGEIIGLSFYFIRYSTWKGRFLFLEDLVVKESFRNKGIGALLFEETIRIAKELDVPVIALSQLSRAVETRGGSKRPLLSDLRESGAIEQDADIVSFIFRPEYYGLTEWDDEDGTPCEGQAEFIIAKHRNGGLDNIRLKFIGHLAQFSNLEIDTEYETEFI